MRIDRELQEDVLNAIDYEPGVDAAAIGVSAKDGVVTLRGTVRTFHQKWLAEQATERVHGVRAVASDVEVLPDGAAARTDPAIAMAAASALAWNTLVPINAVWVVVNAGWITLTGTVDWQYQRAAAEQAVRNLYGVKGVTNTTEVTPVIRATDVKSKIESAFRRSADVDASRVAVAARGGEVTLTGTVRSMAERAEAERAAWAAPGVVMVDDRLLVAP